MWFGQKEDGITGFFESEKADEIVDDDQGMECRKFKDCLLYTSPSPRDA